MRFHEHAPIAVFLLCYHVAQMLQAGAEVNVATDQEWTSLHLAAKEQNSQVMGVLLANAADGALTDCYGATPLHYAVQLADANHFNTLHSSPRCVVKTPDSRGELALSLYHHKLSLSCRLLWGVLALYTISLTI